MSGWDGIEEFVAVAAAGSFSRAAAAIGRSPSHMSRAVIALEHRIRAQLFYRTTRTVRLTDVGRQFLDRCERITRDRDESIASIGDRIEIRGELRVTCSIAMGERFVAPILRRFAERHPDLAVTIDLSNRIVDLVGEGCDLAIRTGAVDDPRLEARTVAFRSLRTCAAPGYLRDAGRPGSVADLADHRCLVGTGDLWHFKRGEEVLLHRAAGRFRCNSGQAIVEACVAGHGICQLPYFYIAPYLRRGAVELLLEDYRPDDEPIRALSPIRRYPETKIKLAIDWLQQALPPAIDAIDDGDPVMP